MDQQIKVDLLLSDYEEVAAQAVDNGIDLTTQVFFHSFTLCRIIFRFLYSFSLCVFFPFRLNCTFTFGGVHFFNVLLRFFKTSLPVLISKFSFEGVYRELELHPVRLLLHDNPDNNW